LFFLSPDEFLSQSSKIVGGGGAGRMGEGFATFTGFLANVLHRLAFRTDPLPGFDSVRGLGGFPGEPISFDFGGSFLVSLFDRTLGMHAVFGVTGFSTNGTADVLARRNQWCHFAFFAHRTSAFKKGAWAKWLFHLGERQLEL
jgi:hypothetical protein